jgi:uncharacterized protein
MLIGVLSDTHGSVSAARAAVAILRERDVDFLIHLGDVGASEVLAELVGTRCHVVFGNCDDERELGRVAFHFGLTVDHPAGEIKIGGRTIAYTHGHLQIHLNNAIGRGADYLLHGHTHEIRDEMIGSTRIINPGALFRAQRLTVATLDPLNGDAEWITVPKPDGSASPWRGSMG